MGHRDDLLVTRQYTRMTNAAGGPPTRSVCLLGFVQVPALASARLEQLSDGVLQASGREGFGQPRPVRINRILGCAGDEEHWKPTLVEFLQPRHQLQTGHAWQRYVRHYEI